MKRHGDLFGQVTELENIHLAFRHARRGKSWQDTIKRFEADLDTNILNIQQSLLDRTFTTSPYKTFTIYEPKKRVIYKLPFNPDRVVQHALMNVIEPIWESLFIHDSYSCRKGKGIHAGSRKTMEFIRRVGKGGYCLKMDISKFYPSVSHDILFDTVRQKIKCPDTLWLLKDIIYSVEGDKGLPVGNYTSQWLGNLYMNELDQFVKHELHTHNYIRYCDDFLLLNTDKRVLNEAATTIENFLQEKLDLRLSKNQLFPIAQGIDFLGYRHFPTYVLLRKSTAKRARRRMNQLPSLLAADQINDLQYQSSIASIQGWLRWCNSYNLIQSMPLLAGHER